MSTKTSDQRGVALVLVLIILGLGGLVLVPLLNLTSTALKFTSVSTEHTDVRYALHAITQEALWMLEFYDDSNPYRDCDDPADGTSESFVDCVVKWGSWDLATAALLESKFNEEQVDRVNGQDVKVVIEVPGGLTAGPDPTPTPTPLQCFYVSVTRDPTWVQVGEPITYTMNIWNCSSSSANVNLRRIKVLLPPSFTYVAGSTSTSYSPAPSDLVPEKNICEGVSPDYYPCPQSDPPITDGTLMPNWPDGTSNYSGGSAIQARGGESFTWTFQAIPTEWGIFYVEPVLCYFSAAGGDPGPCTGESTTTFRSSKVAPVVVGMFNIQGNGKGYSFGASSKLDDGGSDLVSME